MNTTPVSDDFADMVVSRHTRIRLVGQVAFEDKVVRHYEANGWTKILRGPGPRAEGGVDGRRFLLIFEKEENK